MTTDDLRAAVDQLARVAREAGLDEGMARILVALDSTIARLPR